MSAETVARVYVHAIRLDRQGYDEFGAYYGRGESLWMIEPERGADCVTFRAPNRAAARRHAGELFPHAEVIDD